MVSGWQLPRAKGRGVVRQRTHLARDDCEGRQILKGPCFYPLDPDFTTWRLDKSVLAMEELPGVFWTCSIISGFFPLDTSTCPSTPDVTTQNVSSHCQMSLQRQDNAAQLGPLFPVIWSL